LRAQFWCGDDRVPEFVLRFISGALFFGRVLRYSSIWYLIFL
jgi:hypothetical protein